jgi:hypothetical protein
MNNNSGDSVSNKDNVPAVNFMKWPLDVDDDDDDEFRAGYPFTPTSLK